jgi:predicted NBD/HSP70 family sugar kinase
MVWPLAGGPAADPAGAPGAVAVADLRATNAAAVLAALRAAAKPPRVTSLATATGLSRPTVEVLVEDLLDSGLVEEAPAAPGTGRRSPGRPARRFRFRPRAGYVVGVDVRQRSIGACLADLDGELVAVRRRAARADLTGRARASAVVSLVDAVVRQAGVPADRVCAATVGSPGLIERGNARVRHVDDLKSWAEADITGVLSRSLGCPVSVENDANLAALGEQWRGTAATDELMFVLLGERLGAGIITGDRLLRGHHGAAGEIGFIYFSGSSKAGAPGIGPLVAASADARFADDTALIAAAAEADDAALESLRAVGHRLADGIAPVLLALDPAVVVIGTSLFADPRLAPAGEALRAAAEQRAASLLVDSPQWRLSTLGDDAILVGAVRFALAAVERVLRTRPTTLFG